MRHNVSILLTEAPEDCGIITVRRLRLRERLMRLLFGPRRRLTVIFTGKTVDTVSITELPGGDKDR